MLPLYRRRLSAARAAKQAPRTVDALYLRKPVYATFNATVAMNKLSVPRLGAMIKTPWFRVKRKLPRVLGRVTPALLAVLPARDPFRRGMYASCAIVASSGVLLHEEWGPEIDAHEAVIRFNVAPVRGFEKHVGSRTDLRLVNTAHLGWRETETEVVLQHLTIPSSVPRFIAAARKHPNRTFAFDPSFHEQATPWHHVLAPSNGFYGAKLALHLCRRVSVYGILRPWKGWARYHYFNDEEPSATQLERDSGRSGELPHLAALLQAHRDVVTVKQECVLGAACASCGGRARCDGVTPWPVPLPGHCRDARLHCFVKCRGGAATCRGGAKELACPPEELLGGRVDCA